MASVGVRPPDEAWLARWTEPILDPGQPICDAHHHLWDRPVSGGARFTYLLPDFAADLAQGHDVCASVLVEAGARLRPGFEAGAMYRKGGPDQDASLGETEFYNGAAAMARSGAYGPADIGAGIVAYVDLRLGDRAADILDQHARFPRVRGIRNLTWFHPAPELGYPDLDTCPGMLGESGFRRGFALLAPRGLTYDATALGPQLAELVDLAHAFPDTRIVLNHIGGILAAGPYEGRRHETFQAWRDNLRALARCANVHVKIGGMCAGRGGFGLADRDRPASSVELAALWRPYFDEVVAAFGPGRCMFESNFPVDKRFTSHAVLWNAFKRLASGLTRDERDDLFFRTAVAFYGLDLSDPPALGRAATPVSRAAEPMPGPT